ncbi:MAG: histidine--tRNA ligase [Flavobacteriales bacterium]|nr:histidine--tRNA ligase [Flavobacteriales bacterium]MBL6873492.1 histidine--tRNA ligase [Flavobacteriales bacterium]
MAKTPTIPKGTRDFSPSDMRKRNYVFQILKQAFEKYGFDQIETPAMENLDTLTGKYGDEGDKLIFKILNSGDFLSDTQYNANSTYRSIVSDISKKALRYDLTVPFARYVVQNRNDITFPFRRYQIQNVWRADRPQKGRYREFFQCDADIIGTESLISELELIQLYDDVFDTLKLNDFSIKLNNRKVLSGIAEVIGERDRLIDITIALDKLDKIGQEKVKQELMTKGLSEQSINKLDLLFTLNGTSDEKLNTLKQFLTNSEIGLKGVDELAFIINSFKKINLKAAKLEIDVTLARGLDYYTGAIIEVVANQVKIGSIGGGGRYDNLTGVFGLDNMSGVGVSFGFDRICLVLNELNLFPEISKSNTRVLFANFGSAEALYAYNLLNILRDKGVNSEIYPSSDKLKKQMQYADRKGVEFVVLIGDNEIKENILTVKNMFDGSQKNMTFEDFILTLKPN